MIIICYILLWGDNLTKTNGLKRLQRSNTFECVAKTNTQVQYTHVCLIMALQIVSLLVIDNLEFRYDKRTKEVEPGVT